MLFRDSSGRDANGRSHQLAWSISVMFTLMAAMLAAAGLSAAPRPPADPQRASDEALQQIRDGFDQRVRRALEAQRGKPLVRAKKRPPLSPGRGNYVRQYSWSIVDFATRCFLLDEQINEANEALLENAQHYLDNPKDINDRDSFHWHSEMLCRLIEFYGTKGSRAASRMKPLVESRVLETLWAYVSHLDRVAEADVVRSGTWHIYLSDNHHVMHFITGWHVAKLFKDLPQYRNRKYDDGLTAAEHYAAWSAYIPAFCTERAKKGLFVETASGGYNMVALKGLYNVFDFADSPLLKRRVQCLLDLYWATWAQEQFDGVRGGGMARIYQTGSDRNIIATEDRQLAWFYFGLDKPRDFASPLLAALTSAYRPPLLVCDLACNPASRGTYAIHQRLLGLAEPGFNRPPDYRLRTDVSGIHRYSWCTPAFILGTLMIEPRPASDWTQISSQNRWHGVIFAGHPCARIMPQCQAADGRVAFNTQWSVQHRGTLICQKLKTHEKAKAMRVWFPNAGLTNRQEQAGWVFVEAPKAYAAVRVVSGATSWEPETGLVKGDWLRCKEEWTPVILEVAEKEDFSDSAGFRKAVLALPLSLRDGVLNYQGLSGDGFTFFTAQDKLPRINDAPVDYSPPKVFDSPFIQSEWNSGVVTLAKDGRTSVLDFIKP